MAFLSSTALLTAYQEPRDSNLVLTLTPVGVRLVASPRTPDPAATQSPSAATQSLPFLFPFSVAAALVPTVHKTISNLRGNCNVYTCVMPS